MVGTGVAAVGAIGALLGSGPAQIKADVLSFSSDFNSVAEILAVLRQLQEDAQLVTVVTSELDYENMIVQHFELGRTADTGTGATITIEFKQLRIVEAKIVNVPAPTEVRGAKPVSKGRQNPKPNAKLESVALNKFLGAGGKL